MCLTDGQVEMLARFRNHEPSVKLSHVASTTDEAAPGPFKAFVKVARRFFREPVLSKVEGLRTKGSAVVSRQHSPARSRGEA